MHKADFERLLATRARARSVHFALHHLPVAPSPPARPSAASATEELSTGIARSCPQVVDDSPAGLWVGCVVPKRNARRAVTRNLLKRQIRSAFVRHAFTLPRGLWLVRLRAGFPATTFVSAASAALARAASVELDHLLGAGPALRG